MQRAVVQKMTEIAPARVAAAGTSRIGVIDIGSNSVRLVIYDGCSRSPDRYYSEKSICALGADIDETGRLNPQGCEDALATLKRFCVLLESIRVDVVDVVATAAVREAADRDQFVEQVLQRTGLRVRILSGEEESLLATQGVLLGVPAASGVVADLGGGSLELGRVDNGEVRACTSQPMGSLRMVGHGYTTHQMKSKIRTYLDRFEWPAEKQSVLYLVGGSWRAIARIHMRRTSYPVRVLHGYSLGRKEAREMARWTQERMPSGLRPFSVASISRLEVVPYAAVVMDRLIKRVRPKQVMFSNFGLREGLYYQHLSESCRGEDPLLAGCERLESRHARSSGYGKELYAWLQPLLQRAKESEQRLVRAACLVNDIEWRENPNSRAVIAFESMMRFTVSGVSHLERLFIAAALLFRHEGGRRATEIPALGLLPSETLAWAEALGNAMRVGEALSGAAQGVLPQCQLNADAVSRIEVVLPAGLADLQGETLDKEIRTLGQSMSRKPRIVITSK